MILADFSGREPKVSIVRKGACPVKTATIDKVAIEQEGEDLRAIIDPFGGTEENWSLPESDRPVAEWPSDEQVDADDGWEFGYPDASRVDHPDNQFVPRIIDRIDQTENLAVFEVFYFLLFDTRALNTNQGVCYDGTLRIEKPIE